MSPANVCALAQVLRSAVAYAAGGPPAYDGIGVHHTRSQTPCKRSWIESACASGRDMCRVQLRLDLRTCAAIRVHFMDVLLVNVASSEF